MAELLESVAETISRYNMFAAGQRVGVAVSGGPDSMCLLHVLFELAPRWNLHLEMIHVDHQLRGEESRADALFVRAAAGKLGLPFHLKEVDIRAADDNIEQAARKARLDFFFSLMRDRSLARVATGHTRSDQAETVLFRLLRGTGPGGLAGIRPVTDEGIVRPLIHQSRDQVSQWLAARGIPSRLDSTNVDPKMSRNRIRHVLLPQLERDWNPQIRETLTRLAEIASDEEDFWSQEIKRAFGQAAQIRPDAVILDCARLSALHPAVARRIVRAAVQMVRGDLRQVSFQHVETVRELALQAEGDGSVELPGVGVTRSFDQIRLTRAGVVLPPAPYQTQLQVPGRTVIPGGSEICVIKLKKEEAARDWRYTNKGNDLDWVQVMQRGPLELRNWRPGDQYQPMGADRPIKVKLLFQKARVPSWERAAWPIITMGEQIVWVGGFGVAHGNAAGAASSEVLRVEHRAAESNL